MIDTSQPLIDRDDDGAIDEGALVATIAKANTILHNGAIAATGRGQVISALVLCLVDEPGPVAGESAEALVDAINARVAAALQRRGCAELAHRFRINVPATLANHARFADALVRTLELLAGAAMRPALDSGGDLLGHFYEAFLKYGNWAKELGIVLTPRHVARFAARILDVSPGDLVYDPTCGTGGFLVAALEHSRRGREGDRALVFGVEQEPTLVSLAVANLLLMGVRTPRITEANCVHAWLHAERGADGSAAELRDRDFAGRLPPITKVLMNPPFALEDEEQHEHRFVDHALAQMRVGGLLFAILPYSSLIRDGPLHRWRRDELLGRNTLVSVISFPEDLFYPAAGKHTCGIVVRKGIPHDPRANVLWVKIADDGYAKRKRTRVANGAVGDDDLGRSSDAIARFVRDGTVPRPFPRALKAAPIARRDANLELVPEVHLDNREHALADLRGKLEALLRGMLSVAILDGRFPFGCLNEPPRKGRVPDLGTQAWSEAALGGLFEVENGYPAGSFRLAREKGGDRVPLFRPTSTIHNLVAGWIDRTSAVEPKVRGAGTLLVSTDGEGSHSFAYVAPVDFVPNSNTAVLAPRRPLPLSFLLYVAVAVTDERWRFSYGRKPKGTRLKELMLKIPMREGAVDVRAFESLARSIPEYALVRATLERSDRDSRRGDRGRREGVPSADPDPARESP